MLRATPPDQGLWQTAAAAAAVALQFRLNGALVHATGQQLPQCSDGWNCACAVLPAGTRQQPAETCVAHEAAETCVTSAMRQPCQTSGHLLLMSVRTFDVRCFWLASNASTCSRSLSLCAISLFDTSESRSTRKIETQTQTRRHRGRDVVKAATAAEQCLRHPWHVLCSVHQPRTIRNNFGKALLSIHAFGFSVQPKGRS